jgi:geranylgeranyl diphosphate synthase type II
MSVFDLQYYLRVNKNKVEQALAEMMLPSEGLFTVHIEAMRYSLFVGGKRIRPILCLAAGNCVSNNAAIEERLLHIACALECIHTYSLIHDDLPAMDDDVLRRGHPTNHVKFGEAEAILAGDGLLTFAFELLAGLGNNSLDAATSLRIISTIARAAGSLGMVGGQALDMESEGEKIKFERLQTIHRSKTGALITASVLAGGIGGGASGDELAALRDFGDAVGLAFQITDDLLDVTATTDELGKTAGSDADRCKATYPAYFGVEATRKMADKAVEKSLASLEYFDGRAEPLRAIARYIFERTS